jgi:hypothetical protein
MENQYGFAGRDQFNANNMYFGTWPPGTENTDISADEADEQGADGSGTSGSGGGLGVAFLLVAGLIAFLLWSNNSSAALPVVAFPARSTPWPAGATFSSIIDPVINRLEACAQAPVLSPVNCPQSQSSADASVTSVRWSLHGDPADGAKIVYWKNQFYVGGNAVMMVTYADDGTNELDVQVVHYRAQVLWQNGAATLTGIKSVSAASGPDIVKRDPAVTWNSIQQVVLSAFETCASSTSAQLPPQCPTEQNLDISASSAKWALVGDPVANAQESFDSSSGLINVTGSFAFNVSYHELLFGEQHDSEAGNYSATVSVDGSEIDVLQIAVS